MEFIWWAHTTNSKSYRRAEEKERRHSGDLGNESQEKSEGLDGENQEIPATPCSTSPEDLSLENAILANFPDGCDRSLTVELKDEVSFDIISKSLTFAEITNILNQAIQEDNCEELDEVVQNIEDYEGRSITLDNVNLKSFCEQQLNLDLRDRSDHQHIYSNVLSQYKFDQEEFKYDYSVKELVLLAIAANDKLTERYQDILFIEENLSLLPLLVGGQEYVKAFIGRFHDTDGIYDKLKDQSIQLVEPNKVGFFSVIALRKEQELLNAVFVEYVLRDFGQALKTSKPDPLYGVLETASLIKNEEFITIVLDAFERYINEPTKKASTEELLKKSFATLLETAISQEHISVVEYLCKRYTNSTDHAIYDVYEQAFTDDKVITILRQQILKNIGARGRKEIYDLILKTALGAGNIAFIERLCKECAECSNDVINYLDHKLKNNEFDNTCESTLVTLSNVEDASTVINELPVLSQVVNEKSDGQSENPGLESAGSKQPQRNIVDNEKDIMNSGEALEEKPIGNNCEEIMFSYNRGKVNPVNMMAESYSALKQRSGNDKSSSKQPQRNIVDNEKDIMNSGEASEEKSISNNYEVSEMDGNSSKGNSASSPKSQQRSELLGAVQEGDLGKVKSKVKVLFQYKENIQCSSTKNKDDIQFILKEAISSAKEKEAKEITEYLERVNKGKDLFCAILDCNNVKSVKHKVEALSKNKELDGEGMKFILKKAKDLAQDIAVDQNQSTKKINKQKITKCLEDALKKLSDVSDKSKTPEVPSFTQETGTNDGLFANLSNTVLSVQPTTPETPNASSSKNSFQLEGDQDTQPLLLQSSVSGDEHSGTPSNPSSEYVVIPSGSGSSSPIQDIVNEEEHVATKINNEEVSTFKDCTVPECDGMIKYEKKIPSKEGLWDKYYMGAPKQHRRFVEQYKIEKRA